MNAFRSVLLMLALLFAGAASATSPISTTTISRVVVHDFGTHVLFVLSKPVTNTEQCANNSMLALEKSRSFFKEIYAAALLAFHTNGSIEGWVHGCAFDAPLLTRLDLVK